MYLAHHDGGFAGGATALRRSLASAPLPRPFALAVDLGAELGSAAWWRGVVTLLLLVAASLALSPLTRATAAKAVVAPPTMPTAIVTTQPKIDGMTVEAASVTNESLIGAMVRSGAGIDEAGAVARLLAPYGDMARLDPGTKLTLSLGSRPSPYAPRRLQALGLTGPAIDARVERVGTTFAIHSNRAPTTAPLHLTGRAGDGIFVSASAAGIPAETIQTYLRAINGRIDFGALDPDARYSIIVERTKASDGTVRFGRLLYAGLDSQDQSARMIQWSVGGHDGWYDADAVSQARAAGLAMPVAGRLTSGFGMRFHPILGYSRMHQGLDLAAPFGVPIRAAASGTVSFAGWHGGHGNFVQLVHGGGSGTGYGHMSRIAVSPGEQVVQGQVIGFVGSTGLSTGPHLHFEAYRGGVAVDPRTMSFSVAPLLDGAQLAAFRARLAAITRGSAS
jgi:murein DD-endopeptidase MepM/ murein hydrolase activator NlpD